MDRSVFFVDGNNWYHGCAALGLRGLGRLDFARICRRLAGHREWTGCRYYVGRVPHSGDPRLAKEQQRFLATLKAQDPRISIHLGRLEPRPARSPVAHAIRRYLGGLTVRIDPTVYRELVRLADTHAHATVMVEKAVDVQIAVDMVVMAERDRYDTAYVLSADGDLGPAVEAVIASGRRVFVASPSSGARLASVCSTFIRLDRAWFAGLFDAPR
jgi:uncharacterized LabA/DUF88 family protein